MGFYRERRCYRGRDTGAHTRGLFYYIPTQNYSAGSTRNNKVVSAELLEQVSDERRGGDGNGQPATFWMSCGDFVDDGT